MMKNADQICNSTQASFTGLSYFDSVASLLLALTTSASNLLILVGFFKYRHTLNRNIYVVIASIALADLLMGAIVDPLSTSFHMKEALQVTIDPAEQKSMTYLFFVFNGVSILSMALLSIDRLGVLLNPFYYYEKMTKNKTFLILGSIWVISLALPILYLEFGYIRFLAIFSCSSVALTLVVMVSTMMLLRLRVNQADDEVFQDKNQDKNNTKDKSKITRTNSKQNSRSDSNRFTQIDLKITKTFLIMLLLFIINYLPCVVLTIYMNVCITCNCDLIHIMRDVVFLSVLSSGLCRAINSIIRISVIRGAIKALLCFKKTESFNVPLNSR